jgi:hypothetical protein
MLRYAALSGLSDFSPEGAIYPNDGYSPSNKKSPERAIYKSQAVTPLANKKETL